MGQRIELGRAFIVPGSESVSMGGRVLTREEYRLNYQLGVLRLNVLVSPDDVVVVSYRREPFLLRPVYALRSITQAGDTAAVIARQDARRKRRFGDYGTNLSLGGSKSVSFTVGSNRGSSLDQSLQATIEGPVTPSIRVRALLSDNNLPIQPQGNTEELEYLDKVFVEIEGTRARSTLGDFDFTNNVSTFSPFTRQLRGISAEAWTDRFRFGVAGATAKGVFTTVTFRGTTGLQGPYELLSPTRNSGEVIIAGTEKVYLDGQLLARGQNRDYVVDYDQGSLTFTPRRLITDDTEISVDFEVTQERFDRSAAFASATADSLPGGVVLETVVARERDDKARPQNTTFSEADQDLLASAGDDATLAIAGGVTQTDSLTGEYVLIPADSLPERYVFNDSTGTYLVNFVEVNAGEGEYRLGGISTAGRRFYEFVGQGQGNYKVGRELPLPEQLQLVTARIGRASGALRFDAEWNTSDYDRNLFSSQDDGDNTGSAARVSAGWYGIAVPGATLEVSGNISHLEQNFRSFDRARPAFFYRDWNLENDVQVGSETLAQYQVKTTTDSLLNVSYRYGTLDRDNFEGVKHEGVANVGRDDRRLRLRGFLTDTDGIDELRTRRLIDARGQFGVGWVVPGIRAARERYLEDAIAVADSGYAYQLIGASLANRSSGKFNWSASYELRNTEETNLETGNTWRDTRSDETITVGASRRGGRVSGEMFYTHREEENRLVGGTSGTDLARLTGNARGFGVRNDVEYEISQNQSRVLQRSVLFVGEGNGDYNAEGEPVGKGKGDYSLVFVATDDNVPTRSARISWRTVRKSDRKAKGEGVWPWVRRNVSLDQTIAVREETTFDPGWKVFLFQPSALQRDDNTLSGSISLRQEWSLLDAYPNLSLTVRYEREDDEENRFEGIREERFFSQTQVRLSRSLSRTFTATAEGATALRQRGGQGIRTDTGSAYNVRSLTGLGGLGVRLTSGSSVDMEAALTSQRDNVSDASQTVLTIEPRVTWQLATNVSVFGSYELRQTFESEDVVVRPLFFEREGTAHRWSLTPNLRLAKSVSLLATYTGRRETTFSGARITDQELRLETRAFF